MLFVAPFIQAQVSHGGQPLNWKSANIPTLESVQLPALDMETIKAEDAENDKYKEFGFRFGIERTVNLTTNNSGTWTEESNMNVWRLAIHAPNAKGITFLFNQFNLPKAAQLFIYDVEKTHFIGSFNHTNKQANGMLATSLVYGENVIVELQIPISENKSKLQLSISQIVHAYRGLNSKFEELKAQARGPFGSSGACNININCPEGDDWQVEKKSVALITAGGMAVCSGALVNNTANDGHPYFLTADHCLGGNVGNWTFYFNHESANCSGNSGPTNQTVSGATIKANNGGSDFGLLEINNGAPITLDVEWAGWDNSDSEAAVTAATGIHHPAGDLKKICHDLDGPTHNIQYGAEVWYIDGWEEGVTEGGSSGSPLFNQDHRIIGQLYGGEAQCVGTSNNGEPDWYGRFGVSWDGASASTRLRDWLDPQNTGVTTLDGYPTGTVEYEVDAASSGLQNLPEALCQPETVSPVFVLKNKGTTNLTSCTITYNYNNGANQTVDWTGNLVQDATETVSLASFMAVVGTNTIALSISLPNELADENPNNNNTSKSFDVNMGEGLIKVTVRTDYFGYETYWELLAPNNQVIASGGNTNVGANGGGAESASQNDPDAYGSSVTTNETVQLVGDGCYTFRILDDYADGFCCSYGQGYYRIRDANNIIIAEGAQFGQEEIKEFGMVGGGVSVTEADLGHVAVYPNPTTGIIMVQVEKTSELTGITVLDMVGKTVAKFSSFDNNKTVLDLGQLVDGIYHVNLLSNKGSITKKVVLLKD